MKRIAFALVTALVLTGCGNQKTKIEAMVDGLPDGTEVYLTRVGDSAPIISLRVAAGEFTVEVKGRYPASPDFFFVRFEGFQGGIPIFVEPGTVRIEADLQGIRTIRTSDFTVKGTPTNDLYTEYLQADERKEILARTEALRAELRVAEGLARDSLTTLLNEQENRRTQLREAFIAVHPNSIAAAHVRYAMIVDKEGYTAAQLDSVLALFSPELPRNSFTDELRKRQQTR